MKDKRFLITGIPVLAAVILLAVSYGSVRIPVSDILLIITGQGEHLPETFKIILWKIRIPRTLAAALVGGVLATGGVSCQGLFRNPLSEPYLLGISSGAALGATIAIVAGKYFGFTGNAGLGIIGTAAFLGAMTVTFAVFIFAGKGAFKLPSTLLLSGIAIAFLCQAVIWLLMTYNRDQIERITFWTLGSLSSVGWFKVIWLSAITIPSTLVLAGMGRVIDVLSTGYDSAHGLGVRPQRSAAIILTFTALGTAAAVAVAGSIGFIGLMVPHAARFLGGPSHRKLIIRSWFGGAILLVLADLAARTVNPPGEIPIGIITALLGAPFLLILARGKKGEGRLDG
ncbi:MAG: iron ABC transporter permease [Spirochaetaceae bacterium]|nr:iron ABC transporter permease [Spirochaetaceae bacterium]